MESHIAMPAEITFDAAIAAYKEDVLKDELKTYESRLLICGIIRKPPYPPAH